VGRTNAAVQQIAAPSIVLLMPTTISLGGYRAGVHRVLCGVAPR
jgi:hypothetical protein